MVMIIATQNFNRILVMDISRMYSSVCDEAYIPVDRVDLLNEFLHKYEDKNKYLCIEV